MIRRLLSVAADPVVLAPAVLALDLADLLVAILRACR